VDSRLNSMLKLSKPQTSHEDLFMQRYERLRAWALRLVLGDSQQAEDLLHDAFIHFTLHRSVIEQVQNLDAYLHTMLRNLHLSQARRLARTPQGHLQLLDYDSADLGLQSVDPRDQIKVQDELRMILRYACIRKQTSKAGSVLILRFFHGYYPAEIARILNSPRAAVDTFLKGARSEAKLFLQNPEALTFIRDDAPRDLPAFGFGRLAPDILAELRKAILASQPGKCVSAEDLAALYRSGPSQLVDVDTLSHLVGCAKCLDEVNRQLGLPPLAVRHASETIGRDSRPKGGSGGPPTGGAAAAGFLEKGRRRTKQVIEHKPKELHISVNGFVLGTQTISSQLSELTLNVNLDEKLAFVEVFSERDVRLFFLNVEVPPEGPVEQPSRVELSDGRTLDLALNFSDTWPSLHAVYFDPTLEALPVEAEVPDPIIPVAEPRKQKPGRLSKLMTPLLSLRNWLSVRHLFSRPGAVTAALALILLAALLVWHRRAPTPPLSAANLLQRATANELTLAAKSNTVVHRSLSLEERKIESASSVGTLIATRRIEVWQSSDRGLTTRRLYDERNRLISGDWRRSDGVQTIYHHGSRPQLQIPNPQSTIRNFEAAWQLSLSAKDFQALIGSGQAARLEERTDSYVIVYEGGSGNLLRATLVLNRADLRPIEETLLVRLNNETHEFRFAETRFEEKSADEVSPTVFEPEPELLSSVAPETRNSKLETESPAHDTGSLAPVVATPALEVEVLHLLNQAGADMGEQVVLTRTREGLLRVEGIVESDQRKRQILQALSPVLNEPAVKIDISTVAEALKSQRRVTSDPILVEGATGSTSRIAVDAELRRYFSAAGLTGSQLEERISQFANQTLNRSLKVMQHAWAIKRLAARFSPEQLQGLDPQARAQWLALVRQHAQALARENESLRSELGPVFAMGGSDSGEGIEIKTDADLVRAIERLFEICSANDRVLRQAFAITPDGSKDSTIKAPQFWRSLHSAERIAGAVARP